MASGGPLQHALVFGATLASRPTLHIGNVSILAALGLKPGGSLARDLHVENLDRRGAGQPTLR